jgi:hypothetical protein
MDDLPIEAQRTAADNELLSQLAATAVHADEAPSGSDLASRVRRALPVRRRNG